MHRGLRRLTKVCFTVAAAAILGHWLRHNLGCGRWGVLRNQGLDIADQVAKHSQDRWLIGKLFNHQIFQRTRCIIQRSQLCVQR